MRREAAKDGKTLYEYIRHGSDPVNVGVLLEDAVAVGGAGVAMTALGLCMWTGNPMYDALGFGGAACMCSSRRAHPTGTMRSARLRLASRSVPSASFSFRRIVGCCWDSPWSPNGSPR